MIDWKGYQKKKSTKIKYINIYQYVNININTNY
jgi:hypothetical protein